MKKNIIFMLGETNNLFTNGTISNGTIPESFDRNQYCTNGICSIPDGGNAVLKMFQMENVDVMKDMIILVIWACIVHTMSIIYLSWNHFRNKRTFVYSDWLRKSRTEKVSEKV